MIFHRNSQPTGMENCVSKVPFHNITTQCIRLDKLRQSSWRNSFWMCAIKYRALSPKSILLSQWTRLHCQSSASFDFIQLFELYINCFFKIDKKNPFLKVKSIEQRHLSTNSPLNAWIKPNKSNLHDKCAVRVTTKAIQFDHLNY